MTGPRPWMKFGPQRWRGDMNLRLCSASARGVWIELICLMHLSERYGYLLVNGRQPSERDLSVLTTIPIIEVSKALTELEENGVFSRDSDGTIYSRAMVKDEQVHQAASAFGKKGVAAKSRKTKGSETPSRAPSSTASRAPSSKESREEREESENPPPLVPPPHLGGPKIELPDDWEPGFFAPGSAAHRIEGGWDPDRRQRELDEFRANHRRKRSRYSDWQDAWGTWVRNSEKFENRDRRESDQRAAATGERTQADIALERARIEGLIPLEPEMERAGARK